MLDVSRALRGIPLPAPRTAGYEIGRSRMMAAIGARRWHGRASSARSARARRVEGPAPARRLGFGALVLQFAGAVAVIGLVVVGLLLLREMLLGPPQPTLAKVTETRGVVLHLPKGSRTWAPLVAGDAVGVGDRVQTGSSGQARVVFNADNAAVLVANSQILIVELRPPAEDGEATSVVEVFQERGEVAYEAAPGREPTRSGGEGVASPTGQAMGIRRVLRVHSARAEVTATSGTFTMAVATDDGATDVAVQTGKVAVTAGAANLSVSSGEIAIVPASDDEEPVAVTWDKIPPGHWWAPGWLRHQDEATGAPGNVPPGLEDTEGVPPGLDDKGGIPPGLEDKGGIPPGLDDKGGIPPGLEDKGGLPPGLQDKDK